MTHTAGPEEFQLADYLGVLRRRWWVVLAITLLGILAGAGYYVTAHKVYTATASVYVTATGATVNQVANGRTTGTVNLDTEAQVVQSTAVAQAAARLMHSSVDPQQLISQVSVTVPPNSQVLSIACQAPSAAGSARCAQSFAQAFLDYSSASTTASVNRQISALQSRIGALQAASAKLRSEVAFLPDNSTQRATAQEQLSSYHSQLSSLNGQVAQLTANLANPSGGSIISNAATPASPSSPRAALVLPSGVLAGLLAGLVIGFIADRRDRRVRGPREITQLGVPVLASLPLKKYRLDFPIAAPRSRAGRDFAELAHVLTGSLGRGNHVILVTSASPGEGAGFVAANLAVAFARSQPDVMLICADLDGSPAVSMLRLPAGPGLAEVLAGQLRPEDAVQYLDAAQRLGVIAPGEGERMETGDIQQDGMERLLAAVRGHARYVVIEAPPAVAGPDAATLAYLADVAVVAVEVPGARTDDVRDSVQHLDRMGATVLGAVLVPAPAAATWPGPAPRERPAPANASAAADGNGTRPGPPTGDGARTGRLADAEWSGAGAPGRDGEAVAATTADRAVAGHQAGSPHRG